MSKPAPWKYDYCEGTFKDELDLCIHGPGFDESWHTHLADKKGVSKQEVAEIIERQLGEPVTVKQVKKQRCPELERPEERLERRMREIRKKKG